MNRDTLHRLWQQALMQSVADGEDFTRYQFAANFAALIEDHLKSQGWRQCAKGQRTTQWCGMVEQAVKAERDACAKVCEEIEMQGHSLWDRTADPDAQGRATGAMDCAAAIRSRSDPTDNRVIQRYT